MRHYTVQKDVEDARDYIFSGVHPHLPKYVDLRKLMSPVVNQGHLGSCTANAIVCGLREYLSRRHNDDTRLSRLFLYWQERSMEGTIEQDSGAMLRDGMKVLHKIGVCSEIEDPYRTTEFRKKPSERSVIDAAKYKITSYERVLNLESLKVCLAHDFPVVFGFIVYESFESREVTETGIVPMPNKLLEKQLGGHAVCAVGYDDERKQVIVRNSWGKDWGMEGYCYFPYEMFADKTLVNDMWTGRQ